MSYPAVLTRAPRITGAVRRERLLTIVETSPAVVVVGPAGTGKTVLARQIADAHEGRIAWCRLAPGYGHAADLVNLAAASVGETQVDEVGRSVLDLAGDLLEVLESHPTVLVIDDLHEGEEACEVLLAEVFPLVPPESRVVIASRSRPAGLLGRLAPGVAVVVDATELSFTEEEATALFDEDSTAAVAWVQATGGWAAGLGIASAAGHADPGEAVSSLVRRVLVDDTAGDEQSTATALAALPYATGPLLEQLGLGNEASLRAVADRTSLVTESGGHWRLHDVARAPIVEVVGLETVHRVQREAGRALASSDATTSIDLLVDADEAEAAAEILAANVSTIGVERAVHWLYRLPAELRHRFPPVLAAGRATVDLDLAVIESERRVDEATGDAERREALFALGSVRAGRGELADAADALDAAMGASRDFDALGGRAATWLGIVRWWAGDLAGARAALERADDTVWAHWARANVHLAEGDLDGGVAEASLAVAASAKNGDATEAPGRSVMAIVALLRDRMDIAATEAQAAWATGADAGGFDLACGAIAECWVHLRGGNHEEAVAVCEQLERRVGRQDFFARVHAALVRLEAARIVGVGEEIGRAQRRVHDLRHAGYAPLERLADRVFHRDVREAGVESLSIHLLGDLAIAVDGSIVAPARWRSKKALEVLRYLAYAGTRGARREEVIEAVWPEREPEKGRTLLRTALADIRKSLEPGRQAGEPSRFLTTTGDRVVVTCRTDLGDAEVAARAGDPATAFTLLAPGLGEIDEPAEWWEELARHVSRLRAEAADRVASVGDPDLRARAMEALIDAEPWRKDLYDALAAVHRDAGDEAAARAVERRWFDSDDG